MGLGKKHAAQQQQARRDKSFHIEQSGRNKSRRPKVWQVFENTIVKRRSFVGAKGASIVFAPPAATSSDKPLSIEPTILKHLSC
jgi:hypothetical protein